MPDEKEWDVFISHASEDKDTFVRALAEALRQLGVKVWYDEFTLVPGRSISSSIDKGLAGSKFGLVVISESFIAKKWPKRELQGLVTEQMAEETEIIPIWLGVSHQEVRKLSPPLADTFAIDVSGKTAVEVTLIVLKKVRPDIYNKHSRPQLERMLLGQPIQELQIELKKIRDELREIIATEVRNIVKFTCSKVVNAPNPLHEVRYGMNSKERQEREARQKIVREIASIVLEASEDYLREAQARVVEKTDPKRAAMIRKLKPEF
jgi:hypothetical protein